MDSKRRKYCRKSLREMKKEILFGIFIFVLAVLGAFFNLLCVYSNNNQMPVFNSSIDTKSHFGFIDSNEIKFSYLSDILTINKFKFSIGDSLIFLSLLLSIVNIIIVTYK